MVFPCGSEIGLEIHRSLRFSKDFKLFGGSSVDDHGRFVYQNYIPELPFVDDEKFVQEINRIIEQYAIHFIFPAHDSVVLKLAQQASHLKATVITSAVDTCKIARSKKATYQALEAVVRVPKMFQPTEALPFPVFLKPDVGQGSKGTLRADNQAAVDAALEKDPTLLVLEYLPGEEFTVDCFTDRHGTLRYAAPRVRQRITNGISVNSVSVTNEEATAIAQTINAALRFRGVWFFQVKRAEDGQLTLLEIAPRVAGTMAVSRIRGVNLPLLSLYDAQDYEIEIVQNTFEATIDRALSARYQLNINYSTIYVDFDDVIMVDEKPNPEMLCFLYRSVNDGKKIVLVTKHRAKILETLLTHRIAASLFDDIITVETDKEKLPHLTKDSIFIDDSFSERKKVFEGLGIPVFDVSEAVELL